MDSSVRLAIGSFSTFLYPSPRRLKVLDKGLNVNLPLEFENSLIPLIRGENLSSFGNIDCIKFSCYGVKFDNSILLM
jgi:hypothetical protein